MKEKGDHASYLTTDYYTASISPNWRAGTTQKSDRAMPPPAFPNLGQTYHLQLLTHTGELYFFSVILGMQDMQVRGKGTQK